jgi:hypothetical protein
VPCFWQPRFSIPNILSAEASVWACRNLDILNPWERGSQATSRVLVTGSRPLWHGGIQALERKPLRLEEVFLSADF